MRNNAAEMHSKRAKLTSQLLERPYSILVYLQRAQCHEALGYPDLAAGDAYKALMLHDELDGGEFEDEVRDTLLLQQQDVGWDNIVSKPHGGKVMEHVDETITPSSQVMTELYMLLAKSLASCGDREAALRFARQGIKAALEHRCLKDLHDELAQVENIDAAGKGVCKSNERVWRSNVSQPCVRREIYPWNHHEPDRFSIHSIGYLNDEMRKHAPKCQVVATDLPVLSEVITSTSRSERNDPAQGKIMQLGIFAKEDIAPGEVVLLEPSVLTASSRQLDPLCDACSAALPKLSFGVNISCPSCSDIYFCSDTCEQRAQEIYHPAVCGFEDYDIVAKDPPPIAATDSLYVLLVARTFAMAETQDLHPLDLAHTKYLWGDFSPEIGSSIRSLPFRFEMNVAQPLQILMNMGLDVFAPKNLERYDVWVLNTLFAKFRGVASAKLNPYTLRPDVAAVHPLWSLANHSCAPNVRWEWGAEDGVFRGEEKGAMGFAARQESEIVQWGTDLQKAGIIEGQEVLNHYCDVGMNVKERREWAAGALGGLCVCDRCIVEERESLAPVTNLTEVSPSKSRQP